MHSIKVLGAAIASSMIMTACGGGGSGNDSAAGNSTPAGSAFHDGPVTAGEPITGVWTGRLAMNDVAHDHPYDWDTTAVALEDGRFFFVFNHYYHFPEETQRNTMGGFIVGRAETQSGNFRLREGREFGFENTWPDRQAFMSGTYTSQDSFNGRITYPVQADGGHVPRDFTTNYSNLHVGQASFGELSFNNDYFRSIQGVLWAPRSARPDDSYKTPMHLVVDENGNLSSRYAEDCDVSGNLRPHPTRKIFEATITLNSSACPYPGQTFTGVAYLKDSYPTQGHPTVTERRFYLVASNQTGGQDRGILFVQMLQGQTDENMQINP